MSRQRQPLDFVAAISSLGQELRSAERGLVRALASVQGLRRAREQKNNDAADLSRGTSYKSWKDPDLLLDSTDAAPWLGFQE